MVEASDLSDPTSYDEEAMNSCDQVHWRKQFVLESMRLRGVLCLPSFRRPGQRAIGTKWVFKTRLNADGSTDKYKARLVAKGLKQKCGIDHTETFTPVAEYVTLRVAIGLARVVLRWSVDQSTW